MPVPNKSQRYTRYFMKFTCCISQVAMLNYKAGRLCEKCFSLLTSARFLSEFQVS